MRNICTYIVRSSSLDSVHIKLIEHCIIIKKDFSSVTNNKLKFQKLFR